tara:strand:- start:134 stop:253 length:120 start_codon:yes stop_codon:yes gene_type:complete
MGSFSVFPRNEKIKNKKFEKSDLSSGTVIVLTQLHWAKH